MAFFTGRFQPAKAAPDDGFAATVVPVDSAEHFTTLTANNNLSEAVITAVTSLFTVGTGLDYSPANQFFLYSQKNFLGYDGFVISFNIVLGYNTVILYSGFTEKISGISFLQ